MLFEMLTLILLLTLAGWMVRFLGLTSVLTFFSAYNFLCCAVLICAVNMGLTYTDFKVGDLWFSAMPMVGLEPYLIETLMFYWALSALIFLAFLSAAGRVHRKRAGEMGNAAYQLLGLLIARLVTKRRFRVLVATAPIILVPLTIYHFLSLDLNRLWRNFSYLTITDPYKMGLNEPLLIMYHSLYRIVGLIAGVLVITLLKTKKWLLAVPYLFLWLYGVVMLLITGSRFSVIYFLAVGVPLFLLSKRRLARFAGSLCLGLSFYALVFSMSARAAGVFGASMLVENLTNVRMSSFGAYVVAALVNVFEGALNVANSLALAPSFSGRYQLLSISPLISSIDGFESIRELDRHKFAQFVPMGAFGEILNFGAGYQVLFFAVLWSALRYFARLNLREKPVRYLVCSLIGVYVVYLLPTYSIRTTWRFLVVFGVLIPGWEFFKRQFRRQVALGSHRACGQVTQE